MSKTYSPNRAVCHSIDRPFCFKEVDMNNYFASGPFPKALTKVIQLELTGLDDPANQSPSQYLVPKSTCISPRVLKVVEIGDFWAKRTMPSIRLQGKWMIGAGVLPNRHVQITNPSPGVLLIQLLADCSQTAQAGLQPPNPNPLKKQPTKRS
jgi:hypothetical protein